MKKYQKILKDNLTYPSHKKGEKEHLKKYRPVNNINEFSKVMENYIYGVILKHFEENDLIHNIRLWNLFQASLVDLRVLWGTM